MVQCLLTSNIFTVVLQGLVIAVSTCDVKRCQKEKNRKRGRKKIVATGMEMCQRPPWTEVETKLKNIQNSRAIL